MRLYRVFPWLPDAPPGYPGHELYVPRPQGSGRVDNPSHYLTFYGSDTPSGVIAEAWGNHRVWTDQLLERPSLPGSRTSIATFELASDSVLDLDDAKTLLDRKLRPSQVVTRDRTMTQRWALLVYQEGRWIGVRWWSYYSPEWGSHGLWDISPLHSLDVTPLSPDHPAVVEARRELNRIWE